MPRSTRSLIALAFGSHPERGRDHVDRGRDHAGDDAAARKAADVAEADPTRRSSGMARNIMRVTVPISQSRSTSRSTHFRRFFFSSAVEVRTQTVVGHRLRSLAGMAACDRCAANAPATIRPASIRLQLRTGESRAFLRITTVAGRRRPAAPRRHFRRPDPGNSAILHAPCPPQELRRPPERSMPKLVVLAVTLFALTQPAGRRPPSTCCWCWRSMPPAASTRRASNCRSRAMRRRSAIRGCSTPSARGSTAVDRRHHDAMDRADAAGAGGALDADQGRGHRPTPSPTPSRRRRGNCSPAAPRSAAPSTMPCCCCRRRRSRASSA